MPETDLEIDHEMLRPECPRVASEIGHHGRAKEMSKTSEDLVSAFPSAYHLGIKHRALGIAGSGIGAWRIAKFPPLQQALSNKTLERYGFIIPWNFAKAPSKQG